MRQWALYVNSLAKSNERKKGYNMETQSIVYQGLGDWCPQSMPLRREPR